MKKFSRIILSLFMFLMFTMPSYGGHPRKQTPRLNRSREPREKRVPSLEEKEKVVIEEVYGAYIFCVTKGGRMPGNDRVLQSGLKRLQQLPEDQRTKEWKALCDVSNVIHKLRDCNFVW
jgi:hypothetical protein